MVEKLSDLVGMKFGRIAIVSLKEGKNYKKTALCDCECGRKHQADMASTKVGRTRSCG